MRGVIDCSECKKPRVIYSDSKLNKTEEEKVAILKEHLLFVCGDDLYEGAAMKTRRALNSESPIEIAYYSGNDHMFSFKLKQCCKNLHSI